tara:strand:+ start:1560 stop:1883 length:324 start_codon:yes stop_codon:yes gene_type:complete
MSKRYINEPDRFDAIRELVDGELVMKGDIVTYLDGQTPPTEQKITDKLTELKTAYASQGFARQRALEYPSLKEFTEAWCEKEIGGDSTKWDAYKTKYNKVRSDNPKE